MTFIRRWKTKRRARRDANVDISTPEEFILSELGPCPEFRPAENLLHQRIAADLKPAEMEELEEDIRRTKQELTHHTHPQWLSLFLVFLFMGEMLGCVLLMKQLGFENPERIVLGLLLATGVFFLTFVTSRMRGRWFYGLLALYAVVVLSIAVLRFEGRQANEEGSIAGDLAEAVVMVVLTVGPAWMAERVMGQRAPAAQLVKELKEHQGQFKRLRRNAWLARISSESYARRKEKWLHEAEQIRSLYGAEHRWWRAKLGRPGSTRP